MLTLDRIFLLHRGKSVQDLSFGCGEVSTSRRVLCDDGVCTQEYIARFGHGSAKLARQAQSKEKTLEKMVSLFMPLSQDYRCSR